MRSAINFNGTSHLAGREDVQAREWKGERERERESKNEGKSEMGVPYYFFTQAEPLLSLAPPLISLLELICKSMAVAVGPAALSHSVPVISGSSSPSTPHTLDASLPDN